MSEKMNHKRKPTGYYRGYSTYYDYETEKWYYEDNDKYIKSENRPCARCGKTPTLSGADYCLKDLEVCDFIKAACCGHGERIGYISLQDGRIFREIDSDDILFKMSRLEDENKKLKKENEQLKIANARWLDKSLQDKQIRYSNANCKELTKKYLQLKEENEQLRQQLVDVTKSIDSLCNRVDKSNRSNEFKWGAIIGLRTLQRELKGDGV